MKPIMTLVPPVKDALAEELVQSVLNGAMKGDFTECDEKLAELKRSTQSAQAKRSSFEVIQGSN
jgi:hypothetical protein